MRRLAPALVLLCAAACNGHSTAASGPGTPTPSRTPSETPSATATASPSSSPTPSPTARPTASRTPSPTPSASRSPRPSPTASATPRSTPSPSPSPTPKATPKPSPKGTTHTLHMVSGDRFSPSTVTIAVGDSVRVIDDDTNHHTFTDSGVWDSGDLGQGQSYTYRFTTAGTFDFVCSYHETFGMTGRVTVH